MNNETQSDLAGYYHEAESWSVDRERVQRRSERRAWIVAGVAALVALLEAGALIALTPLKTIVPYTLLVDRETGYVQALKPLERETVAPDTALTRSFLAQYVIAREGFDIDSLQSDYRKVALWSAGEARSRYLADMQTSNPLSPLSTLPRSALIEVQLRSISALSSQAALVRFSIIRTDPDGQGQPPRNWAAVISYRFSSAVMSAADRLTNPLGFQVTRYVRTPEMLSEPHGEQTQRAQGADAASSPQLTNSVVTPAARTNS